MRAELEEIEKIELYLSEGMNPADLQSFEEELKTNPVLRNKVQDQQILVEGLHKKVFRDAANTAFKKYKLYKKLRWGGIAVVCISLLILLYLLFHPNNEQTEESGAIPNSEVSNADEKINIAEAKEISNNAMQDQPLQNKKNTSPSLSDERKDTVSENAAKTENIQQNTNKKILGWLGIYEITDKIKFMGVSSNSSEKGEFSLLGSGIIKTTITTLNGAQWAFDDAKTSIKIAEENYPVTWIEKDQSFSFKMKYEKRNHKCTFNYEEHLEE
ncbi:MAG: hypothetical protein NT150_05075 [Bacteroidetes bacterium]|nr:hypothetical protein [Bacteroidota bacterium]